ncbi:hypothetical protein M0811_04346 [Anaeramoeba ignava]|uniref:Uncharacterized protein n=1 Tax=Anaeramoeba ignava TaxID=1746090 RepID=A0A9Q0LXX6_ANAIG|nr:hypothetical protein M0811_04346 [Anaeramoeba ignava]
MVKFALLLSLELQKLTKFCAKSNKIWHLKYTCTHCGEKTKNFVTINPEDQIKVPKSRGIANYHSRCKFCKRDLTIIVLEPTEDKPVYIYEEHHEEFTKIAVFECRGLELTDFDPKGDFVAISTENGNSFDIDFSDGDFCDFDEDSKALVSVANLKYKFDTVK